MATAVGPRQSKFLIKIPGRLIAVADPRLYLAVALQVLNRKAPLPHTVPAPPEFGEAAPIEASPQTLDFLARRRSASAMALREPAPSDAELATLLRLATRVPDHGKLSPWRVVVLRGEAKQRYIAGLEDIAADRPDAERLKAKLGKLKAPPLT